MCDSAMGASALTYAKDRKVFVRNAEMKVSFLAPVPSARVLECVATVISGGRSAAFVEAELADIGPVDSGLIQEQVGMAEVRRVVAKASSTYLYAERERPAQWSRGHASEGHR
jgi:acyl-coenzyme A thioesterase PaaI-like protein